jgi:uncharacterized phage protein (TIGR01671 family)
MKVEFRFWDKKEKKMVYPNPGQLFPAMTMSGELLLPSSVGYMTKDVKIMLYTGAKDKNGTKIYEGDIIFIKDAFPSDYKFKKYIDGIVRYSKKDCAYYIDEKRGNDGMGISLDYEAKRIEIIGNVYQKLKNKHKSIIEYAYDELEK